MYSQNRFTDIRLIWTPHYYQQFALSLGKEHPYFFFSKVNPRRLIRTPVNTDTFYGLLIVHINRVLTVRDFSVSSVNNLLRT